MKKYTDIYLVDCENVGTRGLEVSNKTSLVYYFTSNTVYKEDLSNNEIEVHIEHNVERNALDFIIDTKLGFLLRHYGREVNFYIISDDKGYNVVADYWKSQGYSVFTSHDGSGKYPQANKVELTYKYAMTISNFTEKDFRKLQNVYMSWARSKLRNYQVLYSQIVRAFHSILSKSEYSIVCNYLYYIGLRTDN